MIPTDIKAIDETGLGLALFLDAFADALARASRVAVKVEPSPAYPATSPVAYLVPGTVSVETESPFVVLSAAVELRMKAVPNTLEGLARCLGAAARLAGIFAPMKFAFPVESGKHAAGSDGASPKMSQPSGLYVAVEVEATQARATFFSPEDDAESRYFRHTWEMTIVVPAILFDLGPFSAGLAPGLEDGEALFVVYHPPAVAG